MTAFIVPPLPECQRPNHSKCQVVSPEICTIHSPLIMQPGATYPVTVSFDNTIVSGNYSVPIPTQNFAINDSPLYAPGTYIEYAPDDLDTYDI